MVEVNPRLAFSLIDQEPEQLLKAIKGYEKEELVSLEQACEPLSHIIDELEENIRIAKENCRKPADGLTKDESASIHLYTMEWHESQHSLYAVLNRTLRTPERQILRPWFKYLKLFLTALFKLPSTEGQLWRGIREDLTSIYPRDEVKTWWSFSSCTKSLDVLQQSQFVGQTGIRTLFCIEGVINGKNISHHSYFKQEEEILLLPGSTFQVRSLIHRSDGFHLIHLRQIKPQFELLVSPFGSTSTELNQSENYHRQRRNSKIGRPTTSIMYESDDNDDSSEDEPPNFDYKPNSRNSNTNSSKVISSTQSSTNVKSENNHTPKLQTKKYSKKHIEINYVDRMGNYVVVQNTSSSNRNDQDMTGWSIEKTIYTTDNKQTKIIYHFPDNFLLKIRTPVRILARQTSKKSLATTPRDGMTFLIADNISTWGTSTNMLTRLIDDENEEQAHYSQQFV